ncbi:MAG: hypothetical protein EA338_01910 [Roseinatronobacter sp.]|uniref:Uncharacterized protein n=1 Tax=Roseinatronobacter monicus TaxID=393481 RepID=A0A543KG07_9RHOB|nr:hypothetical protein BD293_2612 [Roseinatronobacter monicus]TVQ03944.1 MAG: hypothetical protein EA338_01910 [Roseinatronobacter sp.]
MIIKIVAAFLVFMIVMGAIQKFLNPKHKTPLDKLRSAKLPRPRKCTRCGKYMLRSEACDCKEK